jgi:hypothetical protein
VERAFRHRIIVLVLVLDGKTCGVMWSRFRGQVSEFLSRRDRMIVAWQFTAWDRL